MSDELFDAIPADRRDTARLALEATFGSAALAALRPVSGGASGALIYRIEAAGRPYLLRMETRRDAFRNPHQYVCMQRAADAGIAPPVHHVDEAGGVAIMDFVRQRPLLEYPGGPEGLVRELGALIARMQATVRFPQLRDYLDTLDRLLGFVRRSGIFAAGLLDPHAEGFERIRQAYPWDSSALVASHNDPGYRNILFDGQRLWLVDWETAYRNDPLTDVAILAENFAGTTELEDVLLRAWLDREPDRALRGRLVLMRQLTRVFYAGILLSAFAAVPRVAPDADLTAPSPAEFRAAVADGRLRVERAETIYILGKIYLAMFLAGLAAPGFDEALALARQG